MQHAILLVDDERDIIDSLERLFRKKYHVFKATSGTDALKILKNNPVSLIISDQRMPEMTGVEFLSKSILINPDAVRILLTGYTDIESVITAINSGQIYRYVTKPWDQRDLEVTVQRGIERYELQQQLKIKNMELTKALEELRELDNSKSQFMILINHELKTPLTSLISYIDLIKETPLNSEQKQFLDRIAKSTDRLHTIIKEVMEFVTAETGYVKPKISSNKLEDCIEKVIATHQQILKEKNLKIKKELKAEKIKADTAMLENILGRLINNATKYADESTTIKIKSTDEDNATIISITNIGKPLPESVIEKVLKPFSVDENIMNHSKGLGLGLSISQALLKLHKSQLLFRSKDKEVTVQFSISK